MLAVYGAMRGGKNVVDSLWKKLSTGFEIKLRNLKLNYLKCLIFARISQKTALEAVINRRIYDIIIKH